MTNEERCEKCHGEGAVWHSPERRCGCGSFPSDQLPWATAFHYAGKLKTIGSPSTAYFDDFTIASDLIAWCHGAVLDGKVWMPEDQAQWVITQARWTWREWKGSAQLYDLFKSKFGEEPPPCVKEGES